MHTPIAQEAAMDRKITFPRTAPGVYTNHETGITIRKLPAGGYMVFLPGRNLDTPIIAVALLSDARTLAAAAVERARGRRVTDYEAACAEDVTRAAKAVRQANEIVGADGSEWARDKIASARAALLRGEHDRARAYARIAATEAANLINDQNLPDGRFTRQAHENAATRGADIDGDWASCATGEGYYSITAQGHFNAVYAMAGDLESAVAELHDEALREDVERGKATDWFMREEEWVRSPDRLRYLTIAEREAYAEAARRECLTDDDRAYLHPAYSAARATRSHAAAMIAGRVAIEAERQGHDVNCPAAYGAGGCVRAADCVVRVGTIETFAEDVDAIRESYRRGRYGRQFALGLVQMCTDATPEGAEVLLDARSTASLA
jgi:hypothetical protein